MTEQTMTFSDETLRTRTAIEVLFACPARRSDDPNRH